MSLKLWFPLNGDFHNQGLDGPLNFTTTGTITDQPGKIGQSKQFSSSNVIAPYSFTLGTEISACCWIYYTAFPGSSSNDWILDLASTSNYGSTSFGLSTYHSTKLVPIVGGKYDDTYTHNFSLNTWYHIAFTWNSTEGKLYINGELKKTYTTLNGGTVKTGNKFSLGSNVANSSTKFKGRLNDVRIYDHCLSAKEVEEISKGLVLHYKLDNIFNDNIIYDCSGYQNNGIINGTVTINTFTPRYLNSMNFNGSYISTQSPSNEIKTISLWVKWNAIPSGQSVVYVDYKSKTGLGLMSKGILCSSCGLNSYTFNKSSIIANTQYHFVIINPNGADDSTRKLYINGVEQVATSNTSNWTYAIDELQIGKRSTTSDGMTGSISDFRMYATMLTETQIKELYNTGLSIDNSQKIHTFELEETNPNLFAGIPWTWSYSSHSKTYDLKTDFNENGEYIFTSNNISAGSDYIEIEPGIYEYDITISVNTGNQFYIGFHRYDANKTSRSNNACTYIISIKPTADIVKKRYKGTVNLSTDGTNPCKYISLRILNGWSGTTSGVTGQSTIHNLSLRKQSNINSPSITKKGQLICDEFKEDAITSIYKNGIVESLNVIEN